MTTTSVTPATLAAAYAKAVGGDILVLAPGSYGIGDFWQKFAADVTFRAADPLNPPVFTQLGVKAAAHHVFENLKVIAVPSDTYVTYSWVTRIEDSDHITFRNVRIKGPLATKGLNEDGSGTEYGGNIVGRATGYGVMIQNASDVLIDCGEVDTAYKGIFLNRTQRVTIKGAEVHNTRTTPIAGADNSDLTVDGCHLHTVRPWHWGSGDHADCLALWSNAGQATPNARVRIIGNRMEQLEGEAILGMWMMGTQAAPFTDFEVAGNQIVVNNLQGILINNAQRGRVADNRLYRATTGDAGQSPTILIRENTSGITMSGNLLGAPVSDTGSGLNPLSANTVVSGDANVFQSAAPTPDPMPVPTPIPVPTPAPTPQPAPAPLPAPLPDIVINLLPGQTFATSKPGKTYKLKPGQRAILNAPK